jgi:hypothetical protein
MSTETDQLRFRTDLAVGAVREAIAAVQRARSAFEDVQVLVGDDTEMLSALSVGIHEEAGYFAACMNGQEVPFMEHDPEFWENELREFERTVRYVTEPGAMRKAAA